MKKQKAKKLGQLLEESGYQKIYLDLAKDNFVLVRTDDNKQITGSKIIFIEWNADGTFKETHDTPAIGCSILVDPYMGGMNFKWMTSAIAEVISPTEFKTANSHYKLFML